MGENCPPLSTAMVMMTPAGNHKRIIHCRMNEVTMEQARNRRNYFCLAPVFSATHRRDEQGIHNV